MIISVSKEGYNVAHKIATFLGDDICQLSDLNEQRWNTEERIIFICAMGICVRSIAPFINDKHTDPAVVCVDSLGRNVISVLSGHVGGANDLARKLSDVLKANPVITTQSDLQNLWALDTIAGRFGWVLPQENINKEIACFVNCEPTALYVGVEDEGTEYYTREAAIEKLRELTGQKISSIEEAYDYTNAINARHNEEGTSGRIWIHEAVVVEN